MSIFKTNEKHVKFDLPDNLNIFDYAAVKINNDLKINSFQVTLKNLTLCGNALHLSLIHI